MKKQILTIVLISLCCFSCVNTDKDKYTIAVTLLDDSKDTITFTRAYNKEFHKFQTDVVKSSLFNEPGLKAAYDLAITHPVGILYKDTLQKALPELIAFSKIAGNYENPLNEKLINNSIVFNRSMVVPMHQGKIKSFKVLSINNAIQKPIDLKVLQFVNHVTVTVNQLDAIPYVNAKAANNIITARPINSIQQLDAIAYVSTTSIERLKLAAEYWENPDKDALVYNILDRSKWSVLYVNSEETWQNRGLANQVFDNDSLSMWCTQWRNAIEPEHPHELQIDLKDVVVCNEIRLLPRQDEAYTFGMIKSFEIYGSLNALDWNLLVSGILPDDRNEQAVKFDSKEFRYLKLVALNSHNGVRTSLAELNLKGYKK